MRLHARLVSGGSRGAWLFLFVAAVLGAVVCLDGRGKAQDRVLGVNYPQATSLGECLGQPERFGRIWAIGVDSRQRRHRAPGEAHYKLEFGHARAAVRFAPRRAGETLRNEDLVCAVLWARGYLVRSLRQTCPEELPRLYGPPSFVYYFFRTGYETRNGRRLFYLFAPSAQSNMGIGLRNGPEEASGQPTAGTRRNPACPTAVRLDLDTGAVEVIDRVPWFVTQ